jgi:putative alpha-1,2-mannosidase
MPLGPSKSRRREFLKGTAAAAAPSFVSRGGILSGATALASQTSRASNPGTANYVSHVKPVIGSGWHGHIVPGAVAPFGMVQLSPDTSGPPEALWNGKSDSYGWDHCSGYHFADNAIIGFSHTHRQGTVRKRSWRCLLMPLVEASVDISPGSRTIARRSGPATTPCTGAHRASKRS